MRNYLLRRLIRLIFVWLGITLITFLLLRLTGDPARVVLGELASAEAVAEYKKIHGLDLPWHTQYINYIWGLLQGDFGVSLRYGRPILPILLERIPATLELAAASLFLSIFVGISFGIAAAWWQDTIIDYIARGLVLIAQGVPHFVIALILILIFGVRLGWLPTSSRGDFKHLILPAAVLGFNLIALTTRVTRASVLDVIEQHYIRTARGKGLNERQVIWRHVLKNASLPIITIIGVQVAGVLSGAVVTETVFAWPGIGRLMVSSILARDIPVVQGGVVIISMTVVVVNLIVDVFYAILDPRIGRAH
jgi:peptide/nickel transport system permease protein